MAKKTRKRGVEAAKCVEQPKPWRRYGSRGVSITIIVIQILRFRQHGMPQDSLEAVLAVAITLLAVHAVWDAGQFVLRQLARILPEKVTFTRKAGKRRLAFGW